MRYNSTVQCDVKQEQILIDSFESNGVWVKVYVFANKRSVKQYCKDTELPFREGLLKLYYGYGG